MAENTGWLPAGMGWERNGGYSIDTAMHSPVHAQCEQSSHRTCVSVSMCMCVCVCVLACTSCTGSFTDRSQIPPQHACMLHRLTLRLPPVQPTPRPPQCLQQASKPHNHPHLSRCTSTACCVSGSLLLDFRKLQSACRAHARN